MPVIFYHNGHKGFHKGHKTICFVPFVKTFVSFVVKIVGVPIGQFFYLISFLGCLDLFSSRNSVTLTSMEKFFFSSSKLIPNSQK